MTQSLQPYRGGYPMPALETASVADVNGHFVWGLVSDMDIVRAAEPGFEGLMRGRRGPHRAGPDHIAHEAAAHGTSHLIVTSAGRPAGMVSSLDVAGALARGRA